MSMEIGKLAKQGSNLSQAVDLVFQSFIPQLNEKLDDLHEHIEQMPFFKILKIVWNFIIDGIRTQIILNPNYVASFPQALSRQSKRMTLTKFQIDVIVNMLDSLEEYFHQNGEGNYTIARWYRAVQFQKLFRSENTILQERHGAKESSVCDWSVWWNYCDVN